MLSNDDNVNLLGGNSRKGRGGTERLSKNELKHLRPEVINRLFLRDSCYGCGKEE